MRKDSTEEKEAMAKSLTLFLPRGTFIFLHRISPRNTGCKIVKSRQNLFSNVILFLSSFFFCCFFGV
jgi:hypothetical protein